MSTERTPTSDATPTIDESTPTDADATPTSTAPTTGVAARGRSDPWAAPSGDGKWPVAACAPRQFEPTCRRRLSNLVDYENAYSG